MSTSVQPPTSFDHAGYPSEGTATTKVYPALLSRVAKAFLARVPRADRVKDGLTYHDTFDGHDAVDHLARIIHTTDRNLALLIGRALDAQAFFHDVRCGHRLRDNVLELYQFRRTIQKLPESPFGKSASGEVAPDSFDGLDTDTSVAQAAAAAVEEEEAMPTGVFTLLTDCYSPTCTTDHLCYSIACPRRVQQQIRLGMRPPPLELRKEPSRELDSEFLGVTEHDSRPQSDKKSCIHRICEYLLRL
ncbi:Rho guanyl-nucleotide exchange factor [Mycena sanguinolenta]|uniref:Rho guanyl-nucleotide exchange factor n=1 Tax=Mycena sanguinolenta TaxID=230812 RepID=A0A8H6Z4D7_9AGAR|nr:Rho guanyl-nucleotide exchange factor [Mycena sanguinolenta]